MRPLVVGRRKNAPDADQDDQRQHDPQEEAEGRSTTSGDGRVSLREAALVALKREVEREAHCDDHEEPYAGEDECLHRPAGRIHARGFGIRRPEPARLPSFEYAILGRGELLARSPRACRSARLASREAMSPEDVGAGSPTLTPARLASQPVTRDRASAKLGRGRIGELGECLRPHELDPRRRAPRTPARTDSERSRRRTPRRGGRARGRASAICPDPDPERRRERSPRSDAQRPGPASQAATRNKTPPTMSHRYDERRSCLRMSQALPAAVRFSVSATSESTTYADDVGGDDSNHADDDRGNPDPVHRAPTVAAQPGAERERCECEERQHPRQRLQELKRVLSGVELVRPEDLDGAHVCRELVLDLAAKADSVGRLQHDQLEVERDDPSIRRHRPAIGLEHPDERLVRLLHRECPQPLEPGLPERSPRADRSPSRRPSQAPRGTSGPRQLVVDLGLDVDRAEELVHDLRGDRRANRVVLDELGARVDELVRVERDAIHPDCERREQQQQAGDHEDDPRDDGASQLEPSRNVAWSDLTARSTSVRATRRDLDRRGRDQPEVDVAVGQGGTSARRHRGSSASPLRRVTPCRRSAISSTSNAPIDSCARASARRAAEASSWDAERDLGGEQRRSGGSCPR